MADLFSIMKQMNKDLKENVAQRPNYQFKCNQVWVNFRKEYIVKSADTIEELCDCFIGKVSDEEYIHLIGLWERKHYPSIKEVYGAIWTDKGLIYVAKMNDKGELELL